MLNKNLSRRNFITYFASILLFIFFAEIFLKEESQKLNSSLKKQIDNYNSKRKLQLKNNISKAIENDLKNEKTIWIGKKLYTYAEIK